jgi:hypothetical protein
VKDYHQFNMEEKFVKISIRPEQSIQSGDVLGIHVNEKIPNVMLDKIRLIKGINWTFQENFDLYYVRVNVSKMFSTEEVKKSIINAIRYSYDGFGILDISDIGNHVSYEQVKIDERDDSYYAHSKDHYTPDDEMNGK